MHWKIPNYFYYFCHVELSATLAIVIVLRSARQCNQKNKQKKDLVPGGCGVLCYFGKERTVETPEPQSITLSVCALGDKNHAWNFPQASLS